MIITLSSRVRSFYWGYCWKKKLKWEDKMGKTTLWKSCVSHFSTLWHSDIWTSYNDSISVAFSVFPASPKWKIHTTENTETYLLRCLYRPSMKFYKNWYILTRPRYHSINTFGYCHHNRPADFPPNCSIGTQHKVESMLQEMALFIHSNYTNVSKCMCWWFIDVKILNVAPLNPSSHQAFPNNPCSTLFVGRADPAASILPSVYPSINPLCH